MFSHLQTNNGYALSNTTASESVNGEVIRRQIRTTGGQLPQNALKVLPTTHPPFWPAQTYAKTMSNGFNNQSMATDDAITLRPVSILQDQGLPMQSFNTSMAQRTGIVSTVPIQPAMFPKPPHFSPEINSQGIDQFPDQEPAGSNDSMEYVRVFASLAGSLAIGIGAGVMAILAFQLLLNLNYYESPTLSGIQLVEGSLPQILRDLSTALCTATLTCSLCSVMASFLHTYLCLRIIGRDGNGSGWKQRVDAYRQRTAYIRALSNGGFFAGIIIFMIALITYQQLLSTAFGSLILSIVITVIIGVGALFCTITLILGFYFAGVCQELRTPRQAAKKEASEKLGTLF